MKVCAACCKELPRESFSKKQWGSKRFNRRCRECIDSSNQVVQLKSPPENSAPDGDSMECWICFEPGPDESGQPLQRDCSCRGAAGFVHMSCITKLAETRTEEKWITDDFNEASEMMDNWAQCPNCNQTYGGSLYLPMAGAFVSFVENKYPNNQFRRLMALQLKLDSFGHMKHLRQEQINEARQVAGEIMLAIAKKKKAEPKLPIKYLTVEAYAYRHLGCIATIEGTEESKEAAVRYIEKFRDLMCKMGLSETTYAEDDLLMAKIISGRDTDGLEVLEVHKASYERHLKEEGEESFGTIFAGTNFAVDLMGAHRGIEAVRLLTKLFATSKRVYGPENSVTKTTKLAFEVIRRVGVGIDIGNKLIEVPFQVLGCEEDERGGLQYSIKGCPSVKGPIGEAENAIAFTECAEHLFYFKGTPVVCHGFTDSWTELNGKIGNLGSRDEEKNLYLVHFEDEEIEPGYVSPRNFRILFEIDA